MTGEVLDIASMVFVAGAAAPAPATIRHDAEKEPPAERPGRRAVESFLIESDGASDHGEQAGQTISLFVMSPYPSVRAGLRVLLDAEQRFEVVGEGSLLDPLFPGDPDSLVDIVVIDLPTLESLDIVVAGAAQLQAAGLVLLGPLPDDPRLLARLTGRPWAYLRREADGAELATAVTTVHSGLLAIDPSFAARLLSPGVSVRQPAAGTEIEDLTARELEVLALLAEGIPNKAIARRLGISDHTVKFHVGSVLGKLGAASRTEAVRVGAQRGLIAL